MANNLIINRLFTLAAFQKLIDGTDSRVYSEIVNSYVDKSAVHTNGEAIAEIYKFMKKEYRNHKTNELDAWDNVITIEDTKRNKTYNFIERDLMIALEHIWYSL